MLKFLNRHLLTKNKTFLLKRCGRAFRFSKADGITEMQSYDHFIMPKNSENKNLIFNDEELKPYFQLDKVKKQFSGWRKTFRVKFVETTDIQKKYHADVKNIMKF